MGAHLIGGEFQSDKYPTTPRGKVPLSVRDVDAQDLLWEYAQRRRIADLEGGEEFAADLEAALFLAGYRPAGAAYHHIVVADPDPDRFVRDFVAAAKSGTPKAFTDDPTKPNKPGGGHG